MLVIHPDECIDCGVCEPECPETAILPGTAEAAHRWLALNDEYSRKWPNISSKGEVPADARDFHGVPDKFARYFEPEPGSR